MKWVNMGLRMNVVISEAASNRLYSKIVVLKTSKNSQKSFFFREHV